MRDILVDFCSIEELSLSGGREIIRIELGNQVSEMARLMRTEETNLLVKSQKCARDLRPDRLEDSRIMKNLGDNSRFARSGPTSLQQDCIPDLEQHRSLQQDCLRVISFGRFQMWSNTAPDATRLGTGCLLYTSDAADE